MSAKRSASKRIPRAKRATTVAPQTMGQIQSMREQQIGFLGRLDVDTMATMASYLLMSDIRTLVSILACVPSCVLSSNVLWAAFDARRIFEMDPEEALIWVYTIASILDDQPTKTKLWEAIFASSSHCACPAWGDDSRVSSSIFNTIFYMLTGKTTRPATRRFLIHTYEGSDTKWFMNVLQGKSLNSMPKWRWPICVGIVIRYRGIDTIQQIPMQHEYSLYCKKAYSAAIATSEEKVSALITHFLRTDSHEAKNTLFTTVYEAKRDNDMIRLIKENSEWFMDPLICRMILMRDVDRFITFYPHVLMPNSARLNILAKHLQYCDGCSIEKLVEPDTTYDTFAADTHSLIDSEKISLIRRYGHRLSETSAAKIWDEWYPSVLGVYEALSSIPVFVATRDLCSLALRTKYPYILKRLICDGLVVTGNLLASTLTKVVGGQFTLYPPKMTTELIQILLDNLEMTPNLAICLLKIIGPGFSRFRSHGLEYTLHFIKKCNFTTNEVAEYCKSTLRQSESAEGVLFAIIDTDTKMHG